MLLGTSSQHRLFGACAACLILTGCYWSDMPLLANQDIFNASGKQLSTSPRIWEKLDWVPSGTRGSFNLRRAADAFDYVPDTKSKTTQTIVFQRIDGGFLALQLGDLDQPSGKSVFSYSLAYIFSGELFIWRLNDRDKSRDLLSHRSISLFDECYRSVYNKIPQDRSGLDTKYHFSSYLISDLNACAKYIKSHHITPDDRMSFY